MKWRACLICGLFLLLLPVSSPAWYEKTHAWLVAQAIELVKKNDPQHMYTALYADAFRKQLGRGGWREDFDPPVADISRAMRHYYDPDTPGPIKGIPYYEYFVVWPRFDKNEKIARPSGPRYDGAERWALDGGGLEANPFTWERAVAAYGHGSLSAREEAYYRLGHVLHLLADMSEVDHSTNTVHPGSGKYLIVNEEMLTDFAVKILVLAVRAQTMDFSSPEESFVTKNARDMIRRAVGEVMRRLGFNGPVRRTGYEGVVEDSIAPTSVEDFFPTPESNGLIAQLPGLTPPSPAVNKIPGYKEFPKFFNELATFARRELPSGMRPAVGCDDIVPILQSALEAGYLATVSLFGPGSAQSQTVSQAWAAVSEKYLSSPIYLIPTIDEMDAKSFGPYLRYRDKMFQETIPYLAGLMMHFQDIVREPPFVKDVTVEQPTGRKYWASAGEGTKDVVNQQTYRTVEPYYEISTPYTYVPKAYKAFMGRTPANGIVGALQSGKTAVVTIVFGPELDVRGEKIAPHIDPGSVKVRIEGKPVEGRMRDGNTWTGAYTPELEGDTAEKSFKMEIEARDLDKHFLAMSADGKGYGLDTDPKTVARVVATPPNFSTADSNTKPPTYEWKNYEDGRNGDHVDRNHAFTAAREEVEEPGRGPRISIAPAKTVISLSGRLDPEMLEKERKSRGAQLTVEAPVIQYVLMNDGRATIAPENAAKFEVTWAYRPGQAGGWREVWTVEPEAGRGSVRRATGPCQLNCARSDWDQSGGAIQMRTKSIRPAKGEWSVSYDKNGAFVLYPGSGWGPPPFRLDRAGEPDTPNVLVAQYLAWFEDGARDAFNHEALETIERDLNARGLNPLTAVASLCAARKESFLRDSPAPGDREFSFRVTSLALYHLGTEGPAHANRGEYILQAIVQSRMNKWGDKTFVPNWPIAALERAVMAAPAFFPATSGNAEFAGGIDLLSTGKSKVDVLKEKYKSYTPKILFEGW